MLILGLLLLLTTIYTAYLYAQNHRLRDENEKLARWNRRLTETSELAVGTLDNLLPLGNVSVVGRSNVVAFPGREETSDA